MSKRPAKSKLLDLASVLHFHMLKNEICVDSVLSSIELDKSQVRSQQTANDNTKLFSASDCELAMA